MNTWQLHPQLANDTVPVIELPLCEVRLMDDANHPWLVLVPRVADAVELIDRCYKEVPVRLNRDALQIGEEKFDPGEVPYMEVVSSEIVLPREAMGLGDVKFMAAIGAFLGWKAVVFSLTVSSLIGSLVGVSLILMRRQEWSSRLPYGPYIALAAAIWVFGGKRLLEWWLGGG